MPTPPLHPPVPVPMPAHARLSGASAFAAPLLVALRAPPNRVAACVPRTRPAVRRPRPAAAAPRCCAPGDASAAASAGHAHDDGLAIEPDPLAAGAPSAAPSDVALTGGGGALLPRVREALLTLWQFGRPHTVYGTALSVTSVSLLAAQHRAASLAAASSTATAAAAAIPASSSSLFSAAGLAALRACMPAFVFALVPALLMNVYITGLNQVHDVGIDRVNKPYLPIAAGRLSTRSGQAIALSALALGCLFCVTRGATPALRVVLLGSAALGTAYSAPPLRLKRFPVLASAAILTVRGALVNIGFFLHVSGGGATMAAVPQTVLFATAFFTVFGVVIALCKDVPDVRGDRLFGVRTLSVRVGPRAVLSACVGTLVALFAVAGAYYFFRARSLLGGALSLALHWATAGVLAWRGARVDAEQSGEVSAFYMLLWKAFYLEYALLPLVGL